jgi:cell division protein FtsB
MQQVDGLVTVGHGAPPERESHHAAFVSVIVTVLMALLGLTFWMGVTWGKVARSETDIQRIDSALIKIYALDSTLDAVRADVASIKTDVRDIRNQKESADKGRP